MESTLSVSLKLDSLLMVFAMELDFAQIQLANSGPKDHGIQPNSLPSPPLKKELPNGTHGNGSKNSLIDLVKIMNPLMILMVIFIHKLKNSEGPHGEAEIVMILTVPFIQEETFQLFLLKQITTVMEFTKLGILITKNYIVLDPDSLELWSLETVLEPISTSQVHHPSFLRCLVTSKK